jgi:hypothetical protein
MRFYKNKQYMGIVYNKSTMYVSTSEAEASGVKEVFTRHGRPYALCDADKWIELPESAEAKAKLFNNAKGSLLARETSRVIECKNIALAFEQGADLITY